MAKPSPLYEPTFDEVDSVKRWIRLVLAQYSFGVQGILLTDGTVLPLPSESALIAKLIEVTLVQRFRTVALAVKGLIVDSAPSGRVYPDILLSGVRLGHQKVALDVKAARRAPGGKRTVSRITLGPFDKYFRFPNRKMSGSWIPYGDIDHHLDVIVLYDYVGGEISNVEALCVETWRVASRTRSSGTRNYMGAVMTLDGLRSERGEFADEGEFHSYWNFPIGRIAATPEPGMDDES
ncbi:MAG: hypothetical protein LH624_00210 [Cryobacterium sp.]|nr:hypothetical protein [Cryobacterium sp.]